MSNIASSTYSASTQIDGRQQVNEVHTDAAGIAHTVGYMAEAADNLSTNLAAHAAAVSASLMSQEIAANVANVLAVGSLASPTFVYSTTAQNIAALRAAYATANSIQAVMVGDFLNTLSSAQLQSIFGFTAAQVTTLQTNKLAPAAAQAAAIRATVGQ